MTETIEVWVVTSFGCKPCEHVKERLHRLEAERLIRSRWDTASRRRRKWYELTATGRRTLVRQARQWHEQVECLRRILAPILRGAPEPA